MRNQIVVADSEQRHPVICSDGAGGAIIAWDDNRLDSLHTFIYAQRIDRYGYIKWALNGTIVIQRFAGLQHNPMLANDGAGGAIIAWYDDSAGHNLYYDHLDSTGTATWSQGRGALLEHDSSILGTPLTLIGVCNDGHQGAWFVWSRNHFGPSRDSIFVKHVDQTGAVIVPPTLISHFTQPLGYTAATSDSSGNVFVGIAVQTTALGHILYYLQKIAPNGNIQWAPQGALVADTTASVLQLYLVSDQLGGVYTGWNERSSSALGN
ncbi:MAG TPA: hypothetical protein VFJ29_01035, partial [Candidatus Kapabacteria bacterium]|nr:hypothetical protein [Candidatus Kapabacteria bacterium]